MADIRVLIFPAGEINSIELHDALASCVNIELYGASSLDRLGPYYFENYIPGLPFVDDPGFIKIFAGLLREYNIDLVFPAHDTVAEILAANAAVLPAQIMGGDAFTAAVCRDKLKTYELFGKESFVPKVFRDDPDFPLFAKPRKGQGAQGTRLISAPYELAALDCQEMVLCEYLPGGEYTVDCLTDSNGTLRVISPRSRLRTLGGITMAGRTEELTPDIANIAKIINGRLKFIGLWWFQIKRDAQGQWKLLEISCRCAGSMILTRAKGINLPLLSVYTAMGREIEIEQTERCVKMESSIRRHFKFDLQFSTVYIDFDDTLIIHDKVNIPAISFIYKCRNEGKKIILLTRHEDDIYESLKKYSISIEVFHQVEHINWHKRKCDIISGLDSIFIDNSWKERKEVQEVCNIPVFDASELQILMSCEH